MESPSGWTRARVAILNGMKRFKAEEGRPGYSEMWWVEQELLKEGLLVPEAREVVGFGGSGPRPQADKIGPFDCPPEMVVVHAVSQVLEHQEAERAAEKDRPAKPKP